jgi:hypothetical protein
MVTAFIRLQLVELFVVLVVVRIPTILTNGRFWAEEGRVFFYNAWHRPWPEALWAIYAGYMNIVANAATLLSLHAVSLEQAPLVTSCFALAIQIIPAVLLATSDIPWLERWPAFAAALFVLLTPVGSAEVWLNSIHSQFHLALCVGLILASDMRNGWVGAFRGGLLVLAPLAGPVSGTLAPLFLVRAAVDRSWARLVQTALLGVPTLAQAAIVLTHPEPGRSMGIPLSLLVAICGIQNVMLPFAGLQATVPVSLAAMHTFQQGTTPLLPILLAVVGFGTLACALCRWGDRTAVWLFLAGCTLAISCDETALTLGNPLDLLIWVGSRYTFASTVLLSLSLLGLAAGGTAPWRVLPTALALWMILIGGAQYFAVPDFFVPTSSWRDQVAMWRRDPAYKLQISPPGWQLSLDPMVRPRN